MGGVQQQRVPVGGLAVDLPPQPALVVALELVRQLDLAAQHGLEAVVHGIEVVEEVLREQNRHAITTKAATTTTTIVAHNKLGFI